jgi:hydroxymethylbilane synthase
VKIGTRGSPLALVQARLLAERLDRHTGLVGDIITITTSGDRGDTPPGDAGLKALFVKEIDEALLDGRIDVAVHSAKDVPADLPTGLVLAATLPREDPSDALVMRGRREVLSWEAARAALGPSPRLGTGSVRRSSQLRATIPGASFEAASGNVDTRVRKLDEGQFDALVLATAGLRRLGLHDRVTCPLPPEICVPSPGQGIIVVSARADDAQTRQMLSMMGDAEAWACLCAERAVVSRLGAGCQLPVGALATVARGRLRVRGVVATPDGTQATHAEVNGPADEASALGTQLANELLSAGGSAMLEVVRQGGRD